MAGPSVLVVGRADNRRVDDLGEVLGDGSASIGAAAGGTRVAVEGPFGACTPRAIEDRKVLFIVGGIGVTPVKAMLERLDAAASADRALSGEPTRRSGLCQRTPRHGPWRSAAN